VTATPEPTGARRCKWVASNDGDWDVCETCGDTNTEFSRPGVVTSPVDPVTPGDDAIDLAYNVGHTSMRYDAAAWPMALFHATPKMLAAAAPLLVVEAVAAERAKARALVAEFWDAEIAMHPVYGTTAGCSGGIGGATITEHCAHTCQSPKHDAARERFESARRSIWAWLQSAAGSETTKEGGSNV